MRRRGWSAGRRAAALLSAALPLAAGAASPLGLGTAEEPALPGLAQWVTATLGCLLLLVALVAWLRRAQAGGAWPRAARGQMVQVLERAPLTAGSQVVVVRYGGRQMLLAVHAGGVSCLRDDAADGPPEPAR